MSDLHIDFETRSAAELVECGADVYSRHPTTDIWLMAYAFGDEPVEVWFPHDMELPERIIDHIAKRLPVWGHNVSFEYVIWNNACRRRYGWPELPIEICHCTMAMAYAMAIPGSLEKAAAALGITQQKDMAGKRVMEKMAKPHAISPNGEITWWFDSEKIRRLTDYCKQDVVVERELSKRLMKLSERERRVWLMDQKINQRGLAIDVEAAKRLVEVVNYEKARLDNEIREISGNQIASTRAAAQIAEWIRTQGIGVQSVAKAEVTDLLERKDLPPKVRRVLEIRREAAKSSTAKIDAMVSGVGSDGRLRGIFQYHGAGTGRWAGRRVQPQNLTRPLLLNDSQICEVLDYVRK